MTYLMPCGQIEGIYWYFNSIVFWHLVNFQVVHCWFPLPTMNTLLSTIWTISVWLLRACFKGKDFLQTSPVVARCGPLFNFWKNRSNLFGNLGNLGNFKKCRVDDQMTKLPTSRGMHGHLVTPNIPILQLPNYLPPKAHKVIWQLQSTLSLSCILSNFRNLSNFENLGYFGNLGNSGNFGHLGNFDRLRMT